MKLHMHTSKSVLALLFLIIIISLFFYTFESRTYLVLEDQTNHDSFRFYLENKEFSLGYTHSVMKTPCEEFFEVINNEVMLLTKTVYESYGVGLPFLSNTEDEGNYQLKDNKFVLNMNREFTELNMYVSYIPEHFIKIGEKTFFLNELLPQDNSKINLSIEKGFG